MPDSSPARRSPWPHRLAVALALVTFPLIWVGGLVTTYDAGMAVPDWPGTYGYNLLLYPWQTWIAGPWDLFIEHGHRLLGALAGLVAICLLLVACFVDRRPWVIAAAAGALLLVVAQGVLGGARVLLDERMIAMLHGCLGPLFFSYLAALVVATSRWFEAANTVESAPGARWMRAAWVTVALAYLQLVLGAIIRHVPLLASPEVFRAALMLHLVVAGLLTLHVLAATRHAWKLPSTTAALTPTNLPRGLAWPTLFVAGLVFAQLLLGIGTYVVKYSWPGWLGDFQFAAAHVVQEKSLGQSLITTAHVANGSLILFVATFGAMRLTRAFAGFRLLSRRSSWSANTNLLRVEAAL